MDWIVEKESTAGGIERGLGWRQGTVVADGSDGVPKEGLGAEDVTEEGLGAKGIGESSIVAVVLTALGCTSLASIFSPSEVASWVVKEANRALISNRAF